MKRGLIITLPRHDVATEYLSQFSHTIIEEALNKNIKIKDIKDVEVIKENFEKVIKNLDYNLVVFNGHGSQNTINGDKNKPIVEFGVNDYLLKERIIYARACDAANILGKECMKDTKEGCFIGYTLKFMFYTDISWESNPLKDNTARLFLEPSNLVPISILKGNSAVIADKNSKAQILKNIGKILKNKDQESFLIAEALWNNYSGQIVIGNENITF